MNSQKQATALQDIVNTYRERSARTETELRQTRKRIRNISLLRLFLFVEAIGAAFFFWRDGWEYLFGFSIVPFLLFVWLVKRHNFWFKRKDFQQTLLDINRQELEAIDYRYDGFDGGKEHIDPAHLYTFDLDVFGDRSLFQYINRTSTPAGKAQLAAWFKAHLTRPEAIVRRQQAVAELAPDVEFRQTFRALGMLYKGNPADTDELCQWAARPARYSRKAWMRALPAAALAVNLCCMGCAALSLIPSGVAGGVFVAIVVFSFVFSKGITKMQADYGEKLQILATYSRQILLAERQERQSDALREVKSRLSAQGETASHAVRRLARQLNALDQRNNLLVSLILNGLMLWELRQMMRIEQWKEKHAADLPRWLSAVGEMDAYCSLATFAYNHPDYTYPVPVNRPFCLKAEALGHPLMHRDRCVRNRIDIGKRPYFVIITGANMAGKSTYLRTVGTNFLLACIGAPVWAERMEFTPVQLVTSLRTSDSLTDNESYFFAELKRLKLIIDKLQAGERLFVILDEILKGTNSVDKQKGSLALVRQFVRLQANGIIATHDLLLSTLADAFPQNVSNHCFEADIAGGELTFSYRMRDGVAQNMNACFLMKKMGIAIADEETNHQPNKP